MSAVVTSDGLELVTAIGRGEGGGGKEGGSGNKSLPPPPSKPAASAGRPARARRLPPPGAPEEGGGGGRIGSVPCARRPRRRTKKCDVRSLVRSLSTEPTLLCMKERGSQRLKIFR